MKGLCIPVDDLSDSQNERMYVLLNRCFMDVRREIFDADLRGKDRVVLLYEADELAGFSTFTLRPSVDIENRAASILCSGDTIIDPQYWGSSALGRTLIQSAWDLHRQSRRASFWWLLITSGPRTWGVLPTFFREFHPHPSKPENPELAVWTRRLCEERWPGRLGPGTDLIRLLHPQRLRPPLDTLPVSRMENPGVRWYVETNPGWFQGDELPSLVHIDPSNLTRAGWRYLSDYLDTRG